MSRRKRGIKKAILNEIKAGIQKKVKTPINYDDKENGIVKLNKYGNFPDAWRYFGGAEHWLFDLLALTHTRSPEDDYIRTIDGDNPYEEEEIFIAVDLIAEVFHDRPREAYIAIAHIYHDMKLKEIGDTLGYTAGRICQLVQSVKKELAEYIRNNRNDIVTAYKIKD